MAALRAYSNTITLDGFLLRSHILCRRRGPQGLTNAWCDDGIRRGRGGMLGSFTKPPVPSSIFSSHPVDSPHCSALHTAREITLSVCGSHCCSDSLLILRNLSFNVGDAPHTLSRNFSVSTVTDFDYSGTMFLTLCSQTYRI